MADDDLHRGTYTGQFGFLMIDSGKDPGHYDQEVFLAMRDWEPFFTNAEMDTDEQGQGGPQPEKPTVLDTRPNGLEVTSQMFSINDKALGCGRADPRAPRAAACLMHLLNASAIENRTIALPGHRFQVFALDGNPVPSPQPVDVLTLGPGERIDAFVEMNQPGVWILGATQDMIRSAGLGVVVEYENQHKQPQWAPPPNNPWDYTVFGHAGTQPAPDQTIDMVFEKIPSGAGKFNAWLVNGKQYPHDREFVLKEGARYRLVFHNRTDDAHPLHLHRHSFELVDMNGKTDRRRDQGHGDRSAVRPRVGGFRRRPPGADAFPLPHPAAHGLRLQGAVPLRVNRATDIATTHKGNRSSRCRNPI